MLIESVEELHIVLKISERCNLACSYCYFFFGGDESYKKHPPLIKENTLHSLNIFINQAINDFKIKKVLIVFHGGEPLLMKKKPFEIMVQNIIKNTPTNCSIHFSLQTNGILLDNEWFDIFKTYNISIGISLDGPQKYNDRYRIDKKGQGSYQQVIDALNQLQPENRKKLACLSVVNTEFNSKIVYEHLIHDLKFKSIDTLLPDFKHDDHPQNIDKIGQYLCDVFDIWIQNDNTQTSIRICKSTINQLLGYEDHMIDTTYDPQQVVLISIGSDGTIYYDDTLKSVIKSQNHHINNVSLKEYLTTSEFQKTLSKTHQLPQKCASCEWKKICRGGRMINRYSKENEFNNPSVLCDALKIFYLHVTKYLLSQGVEKEKIRQSLCFD